jgi:spermidine synthase
MLENCVVHRRFRTGFQEIAIVDVPNLGETLFIDGLPQVSEADQSRFNEVMVHPAMCAADNPKHVFVAGIASGGNIREVLKHRTVDHVVAVDIDEEAMRLFSESLSYWNGNSLNDPRVELKCLDARKCLLECDSQFDVILIDLPDPVAGGTSRKLFTQEFYVEARDRLTKDGVLATQAGRFRKRGIEYHASVLKTCKSAFSRVEAMSTYIDCYYEPWAFAVASHEARTLALPVDEIDRRIALRVTGELAYYCGAADKAMRYVSREMQALILDQGEVIVD